MSKIKMKIQSYDESSGSLVVSFASENSKKSIDEYQFTAYQPTMFDTTSPAEVIRHIARAGIHVVEQQEKEEEFKESPEVDVFKQMVGSEFEFDVNELIETAPQTIDVRVVSEPISIEDKFMSEIIAE
jgi:hypothetical protein